MAKPIIANSRKGSYYGVGPDSNFEDQSSFHEGSRKGSIAVAKRKIYFNFKKELPKMTHCFKKNRTELFKSMLMGRAI